MRALRKRDARTMHPFFENEQFTPAHLTSSTFAPMLGFIVVYALMNHLVCRPLSYATSATFRALSPYEKEQWVGRLVSMVPPPSGDA